MNKNKIFRHIDVISAVNCGNTLTNPLNGRVDINRPTYHGQASYTCNTGYDLIGNNIRTCQADRKWSGSQPMCQSECSIFITGQNFTHKDKSNKLPSQFKERTDVLDPIS